MQNSSSPENGIVTSLQGVVVNHAASAERSYWSDQEVYSNGNDLRLAWHGFVAESRAAGRRRAALRCYIDTALLDNNALRDLPIEAAIPLGQQALIWLGENRHQQVAGWREVRNLPRPEPTSLPSGLSVDTGARLQDTEDLLRLWSQFGWTREGVQAFVSQNVHPIVVIRNVEERAVGAMISEAQTFGSQVLVELTELAVDPTYRGHGLASILIRELSQLSAQFYGYDALRSGEYNLTTQSFRAAARAHQLPAQTAQVHGVLRDHVEIETGPGNENALTWNTRWLHNFLVMYEGGRSVR